MTKSLLITSFLVSIQLLFLHSKATAQDTVHYSPSFGLRTELLTSSGPNLAPQLSFHTKHSNFYIGPNLMLYPFANAFGVPSLKQDMGLIAGYRFFPFFKKEQTFNSFVQYDLQYFAYSNLDSAHYLPFTQTHIRNSKFDLLQNTLAYGFRIKLYRQLYFDWKLGIGSSTYFFKTLETGSSSSRTVLTGIMGLGFGWQFVRRNEKDPEN